MSYKLPEIHIELLIEGNMIDENLLNEFIRNGVSRYWRVGNKIPYRVNKFYENNGCIFKFKIDSNYKNYNHEVPIITFWNSLIKKIIY